MRHAFQQTLFSGDRGLLPHGFATRDEFITCAEEATLLSFIEHLPLEHPISEGYPAKRRLIGFGWSYDFEKERFVPGPPLPPFLRPLARKAAKWADIEASRVVEALITEYPEGSAIGWHRDNERFEHVIGVSLSGGAEFRLRPLGGVHRARELCSLWLPERSAYLMSGESRWGFQHSVRPVPALRYSITLRTLPRGMRSFR